MSLLVKYGGELVNHEVNGPRTEAWGAISFCSRSPTASPHVWSFTLCATYGTLPRCLSLCAEKENGGSWTIRSIRTGQFMARGLELVDKHNFEVIIWAYRDRRRTLLILHDIVNHGHQS